MMKRMAMTGVFVVALAVPVAVQAGGPDIEKARELKAQAEALFDQPKEWRKVVRLMEESAALRDASDAEKYECLLYAGRIRATLGDAKGAQRVLTEAAETALARGMVLEAATAYVDAAFAAQEAGNGYAAISLGEKARLLATSPLLKPSERDNVLSRVVDTQP